MKRPLPTHLYSQKVSVYRNLNDQCLSVLHKQHVAGHAIAVVLSDVRFRVQEGGRQTVIREKRKNVHAFVDGNLVECSDHPVVIDGEPVQVTYNPYRAGHFCNRATGEPIYSAKLCVVSPSGVLAYL